MTLRQVAEAMEPPSSEAMVSMAETGKTPRQPTDEWLKRFAKATGATFKEVLAAARKTFRSKAA